LDEGKTKYCPAAGIDALRIAVADYTGKKRGVTYTKSEVAIQPGGKPVIGKVLLSLMEDGDEVLYPTPGYPIYESLIAFFGGVLKPYFYRETKDGFSLDIKEIESLITPKTSIFIYNNWHNPTGAVSTLEEMQAVANLCVKYDLWLLSDEAYFDLVYDVPHGDSIVRLPGMKERSIILWTCSKSWSMTGWRLGAAIGPKLVIDQVIRLITNDEACVTQFVQWGSLPAFQFKCEKDILFLKKVLQERRDVLVKGINEIPGFSAVMPKGTFYLFVNVTNAMKMTGISTTENFRKDLLQHTGIAVCTRDHFGLRQPQESEFYIRFAYSGIEVPEIVEAMSKLKIYIQSKISAKL